LSRAWRSFTRPTDADRLYHVLEAATEAVDIAASKKREDLDRDRILALALVKLVEVVGEAARYVALEIRERNPSIPWQLMSGMRDRLVHDYDRINLDVLWDTITLDFPPLIETLREIVGPLDSDDES
jgi:uncharacterized protein with HEPN domain